MRELATSYLSYMAVLLVAAVFASAIEVVALAAAAHFGPVRIDGPRLSGVIGHEGLMAVSAFLFCLPALFGAALGLRVVRAISWPGWGGQPAWRYLWAIWAMVGLLAFGLSYMFFLDEITAYEAVAVFGVIVTSLGFGVHLALRRSVLAAPR